MLKIGDKAPAFTGKDQDGNLISLDQFKGKKVVLYFYPKANTPGCTAEACNLNDNLERFQALGYQIIGVSADTVKAQKNFSEKYQLKFPLIADTNKEIIKAYGAWGKKSMYGKEYEGIMRYTFLIDENQIIREVITKVDTKNHTAQILK
ncbi:MAG: thioredoxin-dependent thiol peroxidase [Bacteroidales bacterium]|jgi:peroxiredoxin Q/BCP|nr:thioredoxin-dependent thiol peroxidase [Bacteroidales bacterium]NPV37266.1 thioredoxin-dependent thiol peroxidase [Bacteroidales bacterium]